MRLVTIAHQFQGGEIKVWDRSRLERAAGLIMPNERRKSTDSNKNTGQGSGCPRNLSSAPSTRRLKYRLINALLARAAFGYVKGMRFGGKTILAEEKSHWEAYHKLVRETVSDIL
jgi:hypothetical protein